MVDATALKLSEREWITDPLTVLTMIQRHEIQLVKRLPFGGSVHDHYGLWRRVPKRLMRHLVGAGLVQAAELDWSGGSWTYRLTALGEAAASDS